MTETLLTPSRRLEAARIGAVGVVTLLYWLGYAPLWVLLAAVVVGLYSLVKTGVRDLRLSSRAQVIDIYG